MAFENKLKEPILSQEMLDVIAKTHNKPSKDGYLDDIDRCKYVIMEELTNNQDILWTLHNEKLESICKKDKKNKKDVVLNGDLYKNESIFNFLKIPDIQDTVKNYICFEVNDTETSRNNASFIIRNIKIRTISHNVDYKTDYGIARQDLLAAIIKYKFDWSNIFGLHIKKVQDQGFTTKDGYYYRDIVYETIAPNNLICKNKNVGDLIV